MGNILILPDIHGRNFWEKPIDEAVKYPDTFEKIIFLGDYFDPYTYEGIYPSDAIINWHKLFESVRRVGTEKISFLIGNHDAHYLNDTFNRLAGGSRMSHFYINEIKGIFKDRLTLFKIADEVSINGKNILFTHAGVNKEWYEKNQNLIGDLTAENLNELPNKLNGWFALSEVGEYRGGPVNVKGGPLWADYHEASDEKIGNIDYQIFGHTQQEENPIIKEHFAMLDCRKPFILNKDGEIEHFK